MASTFTTNLTLELQNPGENSTTWGTLNNYNISNLEQGIAGYAAIDLGASSGGTKTLSNGQQNTANEARNAVLKFTGTLTGNVTVQMPASATRRYFLVGGWTDSGGPWTVTFKYATGSGITLTTGQTKIVYADGTNVSDALADYLRSATAATTYLTQASAASTYQPLDADLTALAALASTGGMLARTGAGTFAARTLAGTANEVTMTNGDGVSGAPTISLPSALTFTGKTITGGTLSAADSATFGTPTGGNKGTGTINAASGVYDNNVRLVSAVASATDYAEGSWTPTFKGSTTAGTQTYSTQIGRYIRVGNLVTAWFKVDISAKDAATAGNLQIGGLPFAASNVAGMRFGANIGYASFDLDAGYTQFGGYVDAATSVIQLAESGDNTGPNLLVAASLTASSATVGSITYRIN